MAEDQNGANLSWLLHPESHCVDGERLEEEFRHFPEEDPLLWQEGARQNPARGFLAEDRGGCQGGNHRFAVGSRNGKGGLGFRDGLLLGGIPKGIRKFLADGQGERDIPFLRKGDSLVAVPLEEQPDPGPALIDGGHQEPSV